MGLIPPEAEAVVKLMIQAEDTSWANEEKQRALAQEVGFRLANIRKAIVRRLIGKYQMWKVRKKVADKEKDDELRLKKSLERVKKANTKLRSIQKKRKQKPLRVQHWQIDKRIRHRTSILGKRRRNFKTGQDRNWNKVTKLGQKRIRRLAARK
jgi:hypothetical protein